MPESNSNLPTLRELVSSAPEEPGVYRWMNEKEDILYIGKAKNLRNRLRSYVQESPDKTLGPWKLSLRDKLAGVEWTVTNTELEALMLETNMIKTERPKYNVLMKDDKNYVYVRVSTQNPYPGIDILRKMEKDKASYFGPFLSSFEIKKILEMLHLVYPYKACQKSLDTYNSPNPNPTPNPCLDSQIGQCNGLCAGKISKEDHGTAIDSIVDFLKGNHKSAVEALREEMTSAAMEKKFERAARLRDALQFIENLKEKQLVSDTSGEDIDYIGLSIINTKAHVVILHERTGKVLREESISLKGEGDSESEVIEQFLSQYYADNQDIPSLIVISFDFESRNVLEEWLREMRGGAVEVRAAERGKKSKLLDLAERNAAEKIRSMEAKWEAEARNADAALDELTSALELPERPKRIEGYDISHSGGSDTVGSMVVAVNGKSSAKDYRSFTIRSLGDGEVDDYQSIQEVLRRRLVYLRWDLSKEEERWKEEGVTIANAKKSEQELIEKIISDHPEELFDTSPDYKNYMVARKGDDVIATAAIHIHDGDVHEVRSVWVDAQWKEKKLGHTVVSKLIKKYAKVKLYILADPKLASHYADLGFQGIRQAPDIMDRSLANLTKAHPKAERMIMMYDPKENKKDSSLTTTPDLIVIDGGKGQLSSAKEVLDSLGYEDIPVIGLAKREEEVFVPSSQLPIGLANNSEGSFLLQRLRNEAHRFANELRKKKVKTAMIHSAMDDVAGIGPKTRATLVKHFGSFKRAKDATDEQLLEVLSEKQLKSLRASN